MVQAYSSEKARHIVSLEVLVQRGFRFRRIHRKGFSQRCLDRSAPKQLERNIRQLAYHDRAVGSLGVDARSTINLAEHVDNRKCVSYN